MNTLLNPKGARIAPAANRQPRPARNTRALLEHIPIKFLRKHSFPPRIDHDWAERSAAAIILEQTVDAPALDSYLVTDAAGAFEVREQMKFWD